MNVRRLLPFLIGMILALLATANDGGAATSIRHDQNDEKTPRHHQHLRTSQQRQQNQRRLAGEYNFPDNWSEAQAGAMGGLILILVIIFILYCCCGCSLCDILMCYCCWEICCNDGAGGMADYGAM